MLTGFTYQSVFPSLPYPLYFIYLKRTSHGRHSSGVRLCHSLKSSMKRESSYLPMLLLLACIFALPAFGQQDIKTVRTSWVDSLKIMGQMTGKEQYVNYSAQPISMPASNQRGVVIPNQTTATSCNCWLPGMLPGRSVNSTEAEAVAVPVLHRNIETTTGPPRSSTFHSIFAFTVPRSHKSI